MDRIYIPELDDAQEAAKLLQDFNALWKGASTAPRNRLLLTILEAIYVDVESRQIVGLRPRQAFLTLFEAVDNNDSVTLSSNSTGNFGRDGGDGGGHDPRILTWPFNVRLRLIHTSTPHRAVGTAIKERRTALGMTQATLSSRLGIDRKTLRSWEQDGTVPSRRNQNLLVECLHFDIPT